MSDNTTWQPNEHEKGVEGFYGKGVANYGEYHGGYLNFGLWTNGSKTYLEAAQNMVRMTAQTLGLDEQSRVLDLACGMGPQDIYLMQTVKPARIDAVDVTLPHVVRSRERVAANHLEDRITIHHGSAVDLPFPAHHFSHVMCIEGAEHFDTRERFLYEAKRVLKPGGVMVLTDYTLKRPLKNALERFAVGCARRLWHVPEVNVITLDVFKAQLEGAGFKNITFQEIGKDVLPGYYHEQMRLATRKSMWQIRGWFIAIFGIIIDWAVFKMYDWGMMEYTVVRAEA